MNRKVAIFQNTITGGGRIKVLVEIIKVLNDLNIVPDIFTFRVNPSFPKFPNLNFGIRKITFFSKGLGEIKMPLLNLNMRRFENEYDLFINSNNSLLFAPVKIPTIAYIHFPREARVLSEFVSLSFPDGEKVSQKNFFYRAYRKFLQKLYSFRYIPDNHTVITNSEYTKNMFLKVYPGGSKNEIQVIYPPVNIGDWKTEINLKDNTVTSLGRFSEDKRQLEQIKIAEALPDIKFNIIGFVGDKSSKSYYEKCRQYVTEKKVSNVSLYPNLSPGDTKEKLQKSKYFIHSLRNEPFGISTVEAIAAGCIPIVHNSGGQREIVIFEELRFLNIDDAISKFKKLATLNAVPMSKKLQKQVWKYDTSEFRKHIKKCFDTGLLK